MENIQEMKMLNQAVMCPWTSTAPLQSVTSTKFAETEESRFNPEIINSEENHENKEKQKKDNQKSDSNNIKQSSSQFFHFLRLMQLFPNVHPATLHTVMILCKNDFFVAVDKLLYAKRCKEVYQNRMQLFQNFSNKNQRFTPYPCNGNYCQNVNCVKPQVARKMVSRNRYSKFVAEKEDTSQANLGLSPVTLQRTEPILPLSSISPEDLSTAPTNIDNIEVVIEK